MKIVFMGTPEFAACFLKHLKESDFADVVAVVTQPDRPAGRGRVLTPPPVKQLALEYGLPVLQPTDLKAPEFESDLRAFDADLFVVVAYSILPKNILAVAKYGAVNVHGSLLAWCGECTRQLVAQVPWCSPCAACDCRRLARNRRDRFPSG